MNIYEQAVELLESGKDFAFATIISQDGSAPRSAGSKMLVTQTEIFFTIGGGGMEGRVIRAARNKILVNKTPEVMHFDMSGKDASVSEFICGGRIEVLIDYVAAGDPNNLVVFKTAAEASKNAETSWLVTVIDSSQNAEYARQFFVSSLKRGIIGEFHETANVTREIAKSPLRLGIHSDGTDGMRFIVDPIHTGGTVYILGGGHVSLEVAKLTANLEFRTVVIDDREEFANAQRFPFCESIVIPSFSAMPDMPVDENTYILIITRGHVHDKIALKWALNTGAYYIGMIGSRTKRDIIYSNLEKEGITKAQISRVCSPIGLDIGAQTPAEIAVSIAAELIQKRAQKLK